MNAERRAQNAEPKHKRSTRFTIFFLCSALFALISALPASAAPTQEEVLRSISDNMHESVDGTKVLAVLAAGVGLAIVLTIFSRRQKREASPQNLNHQGKLMRELMKSAGMSRSDVKALTNLADQFAAAGQPVQSPLALILCPSILNHKGRVLSKNPNGQSANPD